MMNILLAIATLLAAAFVVRYWVRRGEDAVELADQQARRSAAAEWMNAGEVEEAERMLRTATQVLRGWARVLAIGDLASLLAASGRGDEAIKELRKACATKPRDASQRLEALELRIQLAHLLVQADEAGEAEVVLLELHSEPEDTTLRALAGEALAEFLVEQDRSDEAADLLQEALAELSDSQHDRAASALVTQAYALQRSGHERVWRGFDDLPADLQRAAVVNLGDRLPTLACEPAIELLSALVTHLEERPGWGHEMAELRNAERALRKLD